MKRDYSTGVARMAGRLLRAPRNVWSRLSNLISTKRDVPCAVPSTILTRIQQGVIRTRYRGRLCLKSPFDLVLYTQLIQRLQPQTVIEIGTQEGGSALWLADTLRAHGLPDRVITVDIADAPPIDDPRIHCRQGDARQLQSTLTDEFLSQLPHPWLVIEDSAHTYETTRATLDFFHQSVCAGDYIVVEDGVVRFISPQVRTLYEDGPLRAITEFVRSHPTDYEIDRELCDFFGANVTWNPNGYLRRL